MRKIFTAALAALFALSAANAKAASVDDLTFYTEAYPPYNFNADGKLQGIAVDMLDAVFKQMGAKKTVKDVKLTDWASSYAKVEKGPNIVLFGMTKSAEREKLFKWAGPIAPTRVGVTAAKKRALKIASNADLKGLKITAIKDDIGHQQAKAAGVPDADILTFTDTKDCIEALKTGKADAWAYEEMVAKWFLKNAGIGADYETAYILSSSDLMYAFSKDVDDTLIADIQAAIDELKISGEYLDITNKYTK